MRRWLALAGPLVGLAFAAPAAGHPMPFSILDLHLEGKNTRGSLTVHTFDLAQELDVHPPGRLSDPRELRNRSRDIAALLAGRLSIELDGRAVGPGFTDPEALPARRAVRLPLDIAPMGTAAVVTVRGVLFPYDRNHQTFVNIYEGGRLTVQAILDRSHPKLEHFAGSGAGRLATVRRFVPAGVHHILVGLDHVLFLVGLLLLGGSLRQLVWLVTAFTLGHSLTLCLAALDVFHPPARVIEPVIALSIVFVGADNLLAGRGRDVRVWIALLFGLVHGFGFASVLRETGLTSGDRLWSLFCFNLGVEMGQLLLVLAVSAALVALRTRSAEMGRRVAQVGSMVVAAAGAFWFFERLFFSGGSS